MTHLTALVEFHELAQGYRAASQDDAQAAYERLCEYLEGRVADRRVVAVAGSDPMREALERIARWHGEFPETGKHWPSGEPVSFGAEYGSNGQRDYMRQVATKALAAAAGDPSATAPSAIFEGYVDGMPRITWCGEELPAGTVLYAAAPQQVDAVQAVPDYSLMRQAFTTAESGPDGYFLKFKFATLPALQDAHRDWVTASPSPAVPTEPSTLAQQIADAQAVVAKWSPETRAAVQLAGPAVPTEPTDAKKVGVYYMRDNHTFRSLSDDPETALSQIIEELDAGHTSGMLCTKRPSAPKVVHFDYRDRAGSLARAKIYLDAIAAQPTDTTAGE